jgi:putative restriction endonuclease
MRFLLSIRTVYPRPGARVWYDDHRVPLIYFLGIAPGIYQALIPTFVIGWEPASLKASADEAVFARAAEEA